MLPINTVGLLVATLGGAAVGLERQWSGHAEGPTARFAGIRTFTMLGMLSGLSGWLWESAPVLAAILLAGGVGITIAAYIVSSRHDVEGTTEVAAMVVLAAGVLAGMGRLQLASAIIAVEILLLVEKSRLHSLVRRIDDVELRAGVRFAVMALVILPLLPAGPFGPLGSIKPRELWTLVLFFSGLSFLGHVLRRVVGAGHGYLVSGLLGGLVSSTSVTFTFARSSRTERSAERALAIGAVGANAVLYPRVIAATAALNPALVPTLVPFLVAPAVVATLVTGIGATMRASGETPTTFSPRSPLQLSAALQMAVLFQVVMVIVRAARDAFGQAGVLTTAAVFGLADVDALTVSMARAVTGTVSPHTAALAIATGILANTALKTAVALALGSPRFRAIVAGTLLLTMVAGAVSIVLL